MKRSRFQASDAGLVCHIRKCAVAIVVVEDILAILCDKQIGKTVIVNIPPDAAKSVAGARHTSFRSDVSKRAVVIIVIEGIRGRNASVVEIPSVHKINILPAVAIKVDDAHSRPELLAIDRDAFVSLEMFKRDAG